MQVVEIYPQTKQVPARVTGPDHRMLSQWGYEPVSIKETCWLPISQPLSNSVCLMAAM